MKENIVRGLLLLAPLSLALGSCSSPPKPPTVDPAHKRPANVATAMELQSCQGSLREAMLATQVAMRQAEGARDTARMLASQQRVLAGEAARFTARPNIIYPVLFAFGDTRVTLSATESARLLTAAKASALVLLSGRTDGTLESPAESRIARQRAEAVRSWLVQGGVDPALIRSTWQPIGDQAAENDSEGGRRRNRRVEVELYGLTPRVAALDSSDAL